MIVVFKFSVTCGLLIKEVKDSLLQFTKVFCSLIFIFQLLHVSGNFYPDHTYLGIGSFHIKSPRFCKVTSRILMKLGVFVVSMVLTTHTNF